MHYAIKLIMFVIIGLFLRFTNGEVGRKSSNRYLKHIFNKYGSHGTINFEVSSSKII